MISRGIEVNQFAQIRLKSEAKFGDDPLIKGELLHVGVFKGFPLQLQKIIFVKQLTVT